MKMLIVDDHPLVRQGIVSILSFEENLEKILEASNIEEAMNQIRIEKPELAIVDLNLGDEDGLQIVVDSRKKGDETKFLILTSSIKKDDFMRAKEIDIDGYILKEAFAEDIIYAIHLVLRGKKFIDPEITRQQNSKDDQHNYLDELTPREADVLVEIGKGLSNTEIAEKLFISENTVKKHVSNILAKLDLDHRTQAALLVNDRMTNFNIYNYAE